MQNCRFGSKIEIPKNMQKSILKPRLSGSVQKNARKNIKYFRNETILKIHQFLKAIAHAKLSIWVKNSNSQKDVESDSTTTLTT